MQRYQRVREIERSRNCLLEQNPRVNSFAPWKINLEVLFNREKVEQNLPSKTARDDFPKGK